MVRTRWLEHFVCRLLASLSNFDSTLRQLHLRAETIFIGFSWMCINTVIIITWQAVVLIDHRNLHFDRKLNLISLKNGTASWMTVNNNLGEEGAAVIHFMTITFLCGNTYHQARNRPLYVYIFRSLFLGTCIPRQLDRK